jgi:alkylation response protein AidB-like acyl-CoA dehydrogenase
MANEVVERLRGMQDAIRARAGEAEAGGRLPLDLVEQLKAAGVFRTYVPRSHGGLEMDFPEGLKVIREAARIDGSLGWVVMIGTAGPIIFARLPRHSFDDVYRHPDVIQAGAAATPGGFAEEAEGGYITKGRWPFASGCQHADVILGNCAITRDGQPVIGPGGMPLSKLMVLPASDFEIEDTWKVAGLKATGSHHTRLSERFVPQDRFFAMNDPGQIEGPLYAVMGPYIPLMHCAFAVGLAQGAIEDLVEMATGGRKQLFARSKMQESPVFQYELGQLDADFAAALALMEHLAERQWARAMAGRLGEPAAFAESLQAGVWVTETCLKIAQSCFTLGGGTALYESSPLQRRLRDMNGGAQHALVQRQNYQGLGAGRLGVGAGH